MEKQVTEVVTNEGIEVCSVVSKTGLIKRATIGLIITGVITFGIVKLVKKIKAKKKMQTEETSEESI